MIDEKTECPTGISDHLWRGLKYYVLEGRPTGQFLEALFSNDLFKVYAHGDDEALASLKAMVMFIYNECPQGCHGSPGHVSRWRERGGAQGALRGG